MRDMERSARSARLHPSVVFRPATARSAFFKSSFIIPISAPEDSRARSRTMERGGATFREMSPVPLHDAAAAMMAAGSGEDRRLTHFSRSPSASPRPPSRPPRRGGLRGNGDRRPRGCLQGSPPPPSPKGGRRRPSGSGRRSWGGGGGSGAPRAEGASPAEAPRAACGGGLGAGAAAGRPPVAAEEGRNEGKGRLLLPDTLFPEEQQARGDVPGLEVAHQEGHRPVLP